MSEINPEENYVFNLQPTLQGKQGQQSDIRTTKMSDPGTGSSTDEPHHHTCIRTGVVVMSNDSPAAASKKVAFSVVAAGHRTEVILQPVMTSLHLHFGLLSVKSLELVDLHNGSKDASRRGGGGEAKTKRETCDGVTKNFEPSQCVSETPAILGVLPSEYSVKVA